MSSTRLIFRVHAIQRMAQRGISVEDVRCILETGQVIPVYEPGPSRWEADWKRRKP